MLSHDCTRSRCQIEAVDSRQRPDCRTHLSIITTASRPPITQREHRRLGVLPSGLPRRKETTGSYPKQRLSKASRWTCPSGLVPVDLSRWTYRGGLVPLRLSQWTQCLEQLIPQKRQRAAWAKHLLVFAPSAIWNLRLRGFHHRKLRWPILAIISQSLS